MPIPPPEPIPAPQPPHEASTERLTVMLSDPRPTVAIPAGRPVGADGSRHDDADFIDAPPADTDPWPPFGAFADESDDAVEHGEPARTWQQPPPVTPWHAQHEKPGEWKYQPPEHLAFQHSPPAEIQEQPTELLHDPAARSWQVPLKPDADDRRRRTGLWLSVAMTTTLLLCGGGAFCAYLLLRDADGSGAPDPATAVNDFMTAVYTRQDAGAAEDLVCREARDSKRLVARVAEIKGLANEYDVPTFRWNEPAVSAQTEERATVSVQLTLSTEDEKTAEQQLTFTAVRKTGWLVCEIRG